MGGGGQYSIRTDVCTESTVGEGMLDLEERRMERLMDLDVSNALKGGSGV